MKPLVALLLFLPVTDLSAGNWLGIKANIKPNPVAAKLNQEARKAAAVSVDSTFLSRKVTYIPNTVSGGYLGTLAGVRCFNCSPNEVLLNIGDSLSNQTATLSLRVEVWNNIERPLKERRIFDYDNRCFYFAHNDVDTVFIGGEQIEVRIQERPCYPYLQRTTHSFPKDSLPTSFSDSSQANPVTLEQVDQVE